MTHLLVYIVKFIYSEKATKFCEIFTLLLSYVVPVKSKVKISQNFEAFSEYINFSNFTNSSTKQLLVKEQDFTSDLKTFVLFISFYPFRDILKYHGD